MNVRLPSVREFVGGVGTTALVFAMLVAFVPDVLSPGVVDLASALEARVEPWVATLLLSLLVFAYALYRFQRSDVSDVERLVDDDPTVDVPDPDARTVEFDPERPGRELDYAVSRTLAQLERDPDAEAWEASQVRATLEQTVHAVRGGDDRDASALDAAIEDGSWTDDAVAAAFLGGSAAPGVSRWRRLYAWLYPARAFERRVERVVAAIEAQATVPAAGDVEDTDDTERGGDGRRPEADRRDDGTVTDGGAGADGPGRGRERGDAVTGPDSGDDAEEVSS